MVSLNFCDKPFAGAIMRLVLDRDSKDTVQHGTAKRNDVQAHHDMTWHAETKKQCVAIAGVGMLSK